MGAGGRMPLAGGDGKKAEKSKAVLRRVPHEKPPFTLADIKKAVPPHCLERSLIRSLAYVVYDFIIIFLMIFLASNCIPLLPKPVTYLVWPVYIYAQGCVMMGLWAIGHECGHNGFSKYAWVDDTVGFIIHSLLFVPYFSWKFSHRRHHSNTNSLERDENHVPRFKENIRPYYYRINNPVGRLFIIAFTLTMGWPLYLLINIAGRPYDRFACHFDPYSPIFSKRERFFILLSDVGFFGMGYLVYRLALIQGLAWTLQFYLGPLIVVNGFLVTITLLQHTHPAIPHYDASEWDWLRGALCTIDRDYGFLNVIFHHIVDNHVVHHLITTIPHYHAAEATAAIKPILGDYYLFDDTPFYKAMWREARECLYVEADKAKGVYWFNNKI